MPKSTKTSATKAAKATTRKAPRAKREAPASAPDATDASLPSERLGVPPTTPDVDMKLAATDVPDEAATPTEATTDANVETGRDTGDRGANVGQPVADGGKAMSLMDAAINILSQGTGDPMRCKDIVDLAVQRGLWSPRTGKTPASTLYAAILREIVTKGDASRFVKTERGKFALKDSEYVREEAARR